MSIFDFIPFYLFLTKHMSLVKRVEISLWEYIVRRHQFQLNKENRKKQLKNRTKEKACQQMSFTDWFWKVSSPNGSSVLLAKRKEGKIMLLVCLLSAVQPTL